MITLSFPWLVIIVVLAFLAALGLVVCFKSPIRKWVSFGLSMVSVAYLLYIILWHESIGNGPLFDWYLVGFVGVFASMALASVGIMDWVKPAVLPVAVQSKVSRLAPPLVENHEERQEPVMDDEQSNEEKIAKEGSDAPERTTEGEIKDGDANDVESLQREELIGKVLPWFLDQLVQYNEDEQNAIKACAVEFVYEGTITRPSVEIARNTLYSQQRLMELCSAFILLDKDRSNCAEFAKVVFADTFNNTEISTLEKKIKGKDRMQILIDTYREAQSINVKN